MSEKRERESGNLLMHWFDLWNNKHRCFAAAVVSEWKKYSENL